MFGLKRRCGLRSLSVAWRWVGVSARTFIEHGQDRFDVGMDLDGRRLAQGKIALAYIGGARPRNE